MLYIVAAEVNLLYEWILSELSVHVREKKIMLKFMQILCKFMLQFMAFIEQYMQQYIRIDTNSTIVPIAAHFYSGSIS